MLCERVAGNDWAQESSQLSVESGVDLLVPCREREVLYLPTLRSHGFQNSGGG